MKPRTDEPLDTFENRLLDELREVVAERTDVLHEPAPQASPPAHPRRWVLAGAAAAAAAGLLAWNTVGQATPAYAIDENPDGGVTVTIHRLEDAAGLEAALAEHGVAADVTYLPDGQTCAEGRYTPAAVEGYWLQLASGPDGQTLTVPADALGEGQALVLVNTELQDGGIGGAVGVAQGPVGECTPVPLDVPGPGPGEHGGASTHTEGD